jgi:hypothetical protein
MAMPSAYILWRYVPTTSISSIYGFNIPGLPAATSWPKTATTDITAKKMANIQAKLKY